MVMETLAPLASQTITKAPQWIDIGLNEMKNRRTECRMQNKKKRDEKGRKKQKTTKEVETQPKKRFMKQLQNKELKKSFAYKIMRKRKTFPCEK